jgi:hypothetical protein
LVLTGLFSDPERLAAMSAAARTQAHPGAAEKIADKLAELAESQQVSESASRRVSRTSGATEIGGGD